MGNKRLIFAIIVVIALIAGLVGGYLYIRNNSMQAEKLQEEMSAVVEKDLLKEDINVATKTNGNYGIVEKTVKVYLKDVKELYTQAQNFCGDEEVSNILSAENIGEEDQDLTAVTQKVSEYKSQLTELKTKAEDVTNQMEILEAIQDTDVKQNYIDVYKNIMENEAMQAKLTNAQKQIKDELEEAEKRIQGLEKVVTFLEKNSKYWEVNEGRLQFTNVNKLTEYYQLLNGDE